LTSQASAALDAWVRLLRGTAALRRSLSAELQGAHGLSINDYEALLVLSRAEDGRMRRVDLADALVLTASGVTRMLDGLQEAGLVEKSACASDARVSYAVLTDKGREALRCASAMHTESIRRFFDERYASDELETLAELLRRLPGAAAAEGEACSAE
jgi:DNA-binding MarR family transcriptional regulator